MVGGINMKCEYGCGQEALYILKNGKNCCSEYATSCPEIRRKNSNSQKIHYKFVGPNPSTIKVKCKFCNRLCNLTSIKRHERKCHNNPNNIKNCIVCGKQLLQHQLKNMTCSYSCSNKYFRKVRNKPKNYKNYRTICFHNHKKKCIVCGEDKIVAVHHYDGNNDNNEKENLIPLCPTHHCYVHSKYYDLVKDKINEYRKNLK